MFPKIEQKLRILYMKTIAHSGSRAGGGGVYSRNRLFSLRYELRSIRKVRISINSNDLYHAVYKMPILGEFGNSKIDY